MIMKILIFLSITSQSFISRLDYLSMNNSVEVDAPFRHKLIEILQSAFLL